MSLKRIYGDVNNRIAINSLIGALEFIDDGTLYVGYPILSSADNSFSIDALLLHPNYGIIAFIFPEAGLTNDELKNSQDKVAYALISNLNKHDCLRQGRGLAFTPYVITFFASNDNLPESDNIYKFACADNLEALLNGLVGINNQLYINICSAIQRVTTIKPLKKRSNILNNKSRGSILKIIEKQMANLDIFQQAAAIEIPEGPQRIRGLAGSGKTIVLAMKAAYMHTKHPDWNIAVTFQTQSLKPQFKDLIERFVFAHSDDKPNWERINILHAWGSTTNAGVYAQIANAANTIPSNYILAKEKYGSNNAFNGICQEMLYEPYIQNIKPIYDAIIIDEAQDLPASFFKLVYLATKNPKRVIWAYDELQSLKNTEMPSIEEMFGVDYNGNANVSLINSKDEPRRDVVLPVCYRNPLWILVTAHALGFGIYRKDGLTQFCDLSMWEKVGYQVERGSLKENEHVVLRREEHSSPEYFNEYLKPDDVVWVNKFDTKEQQYDWVAKEIKKNLQDDELEPDDILIIFPQATTAQQEYPLLQYYLLNNNINSQLVGVTSSRDSFSKEDYVTVASIFRAKGNEAPMVYLINADACAGGMIKYRNILFTAITRSRAWIRICGVGNDMQELVNEINEVKNFNYKLDFTLPSEEELKRIRKVNSDKMENDEERIKEAIAEFYKLINKMKDLGLDISNL